MSGGTTQVDSVTVVGGGDVGLLNALALEKGLDATDVVVIDDFGESVPEVGKSTLSYVVDFLLDSLEIDLTRLISDVKLAWKATVYFEDWCGDGPFHSPLGQPLPVVSESEGPTIPERNRLTPTHEAEFHEWYHRYQECNFSTPYTEVAETPGKAPMIVDEGMNVRKALPGVSYHFNSRSFNAFLRTLCRERGVALVDDRITEVKTADDRIERLVGGSRGVRV